MSIEPCRELERFLVSEGHAVGRKWCVAGPETSDVQWIEALDLDCGIALVVTFRSGGWDAFTASPEPDDLSVCLDAEKRTVRHPRPGVRADVLKRAVLPDTDGWMSPDEFAEYDG